MSTKLSKRLCNTCGGTVKWVVDQEGTAKYIALPPNCYNAVKCLSNPKTEDGK